MSYSQPIYITHSLGPVTMSAAFAGSFKGPKGKVGQVIDVSVAFISNLTNGTTTGPVIVIGKSGATAAYMAAWTVVAASSNVTAPLTYVATGATTDPRTGTRIEADTEVLVSNAAPTGGSPLTGVANVTVTVAWF